ncbi:MAG: hypothetical protein ACO1OD_07360 [Croceibacterium sp.]|jgi:hypothetical protein
MGRKRILAALVLVLIALVAFAWIDGGREEPRLIEQPVELPETSQ